VRDRGWCRAVAVARRAGLWALLAGAVPPLWAGGKRGEGEHEIPD